MCGRSKIPGWTCPCCHWSCEETLFFRKRKLVLTLVHLGNPLFTFVFGRLRFHCGSFPVLRDICSPGRGDNVIKVTLKEIVRFIEDVGKGFDLPLLSSGVL